MSLDHPFIMLQCPLKPLTIPYCRASAALGEKRPAAHNAAAAISKASMEAARKEARALFGESSELAFLEEQQQRLAEMRGAQKEAASTIRPRHVPATKPAALQRRRVPSPQPEADFVDLVSSDEDEPQDDGDEAATRHAQVQIRNCPLIRVLAGRMTASCRSRALVQEHDSEGEGSQSYPEPEEEEDEDGAEGSEEEEEESVRVKLLDVSVHDRKSAPHFPPLTKRQRELHRDALDVSLRPLTVSAGAPVVAFSRCWVHPQQRGGWLDDEGMFWPIATGGSRPGD